MSRQVHSISGSRLLWWWAAVVLNRVTVAIKSSSGSWLACNFSTVLGMRLTRWEDCIAAELPKFNHHLEGHSFHWMVVWCLTPTSSTHSQVEQGRHAVVYRDLLYFKQAKEQWINTFYPRIPSCCLFPHSLEQTKCSDDTSSASNIKYFCEGHGTSCLNVTISQ